MNPLDSIPVSASVVSLASLPTLKNIARRILRTEEWGSTGKEADYLSKLRRLLAKMEPGDQKLLLHMAQKVARG